MKMSSTLFKSYLIFSYLSVILHDGEAGNATKNGNNGSIIRIIGGESARPNEFPWMIDLIIEGIGHCGGTLIQMNVVLTAAHCLYNESYSSGVRRKVVAVAGEHNLGLDDGTEQVSIAASYKIHEMYNHRMPAHDIAMVYLSKQFIRTRTVRPAKLPSRYFKCKRTGTTIGWGQLDNNDIPSVPTVLQKTVVPIRRSNQCSGHKYTEFCAGQGGKGPCYGDSGAPLMCTTKPRTIYGIVSRGPENEPNCALQNSPAIFTRVSAYIKWIRRNKSRVSF